MSPPNGGTETERILPAGPTGNELRLGWGDLANSNFLMNICHSKPKRSCYFILSFNSRKDSQGRFSFSSPSPVGLVSTAKLQWKTCTFPFHVKFVSRVKSVPMMHV